MCVWNSFLFLWDSISIRGIPYISWAIYLNPHIYSATVMVDGEVHRSIVKFAVVFQDLRQASLFINGVTLYVMKNKDHLILLNDEGSAVDEPRMTQVPSYQITPSDMILQTHYKPQDGEADSGSPLIDMVVDIRSSDITVDVTLLTRRDPTFRFQRIENDNSFGLADPESAHVFPSAKCKGIYEWLDRPEFNRCCSKSRCSYQL